MNRYAVSSLKIHRRAAREVQLQACAAGGPEKIEVAAMAAEIFMQNFDASVDGDFSRSAVSAA
jgi:hypothetical protein